MAYPDPLDDVRNFTPELIMTWARSVSLAFEIEGLAEQVKEAKLRDDIEDEMK